MRRALDAQRERKARPLKEPEDNGGRRRLADRRKRTSSYQFPERRWLRHRRSGSDRRILKNLRLRKDLERRDAYRDLYEENVSLAPETDGGQTAAEAPRQAEDHPKD